MPGRTAIPFGSTGRTVALNLIRLRKARALTTRALSAALTEAGRPITATAITQMENAGRDDRKGHARRVDVDDLVALAVVLGVSPSALLLPLTDGPDDVVEVTGAGDVAAAAAWDWADGRRPLVSVDPDDESMAFTHLLFALHSRPHVRRHREVVMR